MKALIITLSVATSLLLIAVLALLTIGWREQAQLASTNARLANELEQARSALTSANTETLAQSNRLAVLEASATQLQSQVDSMQAAARAAEETLPRPYRVRAFLGRDALGEAWMIPQNITRDPDSGRYRFEPVLVLDESSRQRFTVHHTNTVQTEIVATDYVPYYTYPYYYYGTGLPGRPGWTNTPPVPPQPPGPMPTAPASGLDYGNVDSSARVFAPPFSTVNSRPQVLGRPATTEINARLFAP